MKTNNRSTAWRTALATIAALVLCACNEQPVAASAASAFDAGGGNSYEVVLETRPEQPAAYVGRVRAFYELCVATAEAQKMTVKPFVAPPVPYVTIRQTFISDGKNYFEKTENFDLDANSMLPESGCATQIAPSSTTKVWHDGTYQMEQVDDGAAPVVTAPVKQSPSGAAGANRTKPYSQRQTLQGVALRCLPNDSPVIQSGALLASCIFDGGGEATLLNAAGKPIMLHARIPSNETDPRFASVLVTMPKSVVTGKSTSTSRFTLKGASQ